MSLLYYHTQSASHMNILIIEDDTILASHIARTFYRCIITHRIDVISSNDEFLSRQMMLHIYDIILVDLILIGWSMDVTWGYEIISTIRTLHPKISIIVMSGVADVEVLRLAFSYGASDYIIKPVRLAELQVRVENWYSRLYLYHESSSTLWVWGIRYEPGKNEFFKWDQKIPLSRMNKYLLSLFLIEQNKVITHEFLREKIWWDYDLTRERNTRILIMRLRCVLKEFHIDHWITTSPWEGYIFHPV